MSEREVLPRAKHQEPPACSYCNKTMERVPEDLYIKVDDEVHLVPVFECPTHSCAKTGWLDTENKTTVFSGAEIKFTVPFDEIKKQ